MRTRSLWGALIAVWMLAALSTPVVLTVSSHSGKAPMSLALTVVDSTPTPTLQPAPAGGGRVNVAVLNVRGGPSTQWVRIRILLYGEVVFPVGRDASGQWIAITVDQYVGWVWVEAVTWDPALDLQALPVITPPSTSTLPASATASATPGETPTVSSVTPPTLPPTPRPSLTATYTPQPSPAATPTPASEAATVAPTSVPTVQPTLTREPPSPSPILPRLPSPSFGTSIGIGGLGLLAILYVWRFALGQREVRRYKNGFSLQTCPTCQTGHLILEEHVRRPLGIAIIARSVLCDACRSVLRQVRPGLWRYTIDAFVNSALAEEYNGHTFSDASLSALAEVAHNYPPTNAPVQLPPVSPEFQQAVEHLEVLEAQVLAAEQDDQGFDTDLDGATSEAEQQE